VIFLYESLTVGIGINIYICYMFRDHYLTPLICLRVFMQESSLTKKWWPSQHRQEYIEQMNT